MLFLLRLLQNHCGLFSEQQSLSAGTSPQSNDYRTLRGAHFAKVLFEAAGRAEPWILSLGAIFGKPWPVDAVGREDPWVSALNLTPLKT